LWAKTGVFYKERGGFIHANSIKTGCSILIGRHLGWLFWSPKYLLLFSTKIHLKIHWPVARNDWSQRLGNVAIHFQLKAITEILKSIGSVFHLISTVSCTTVTFVIIYFWQIFCTLTFVMGFDLFKQRSVMICKYKKICALFHENFIMTYRTLFPGSTRIPPWWTNGKVSELCSPKEKLNLDASFL